MERKVLGAIAIAVILIMGIVIIQGTVFAGLERSAVAEYERTVGALAPARTELDGRADQLRSLVTERPELLGRLATTEGWTTQLSSAQEMISSARESLDEQVKPLIEKDEREDTQKVLALVSASRAAAERANAMVAGIEEKARRLVDFAENKDRILEAAHGHAQAIAAADLSGIRSQCEKAWTSCTEKDADIRERLSRLEAMKTQGEPLGREIASMGQKPIGEISPSELLANCESIEDLATRLPVEIQALSALLDQLSYSYDKILVDMNIREGAEVEFFHEYRTITVDSADEVTESREWQQVEKATFEKHKEHLGMTIQSKPKCRYDHEAESIAQPPGYSYVGNSHYGRWEDRSGTRFWVFYGQYSMMRSLFWGPSYSPIGYSSWSGYNDYRTRGRTYYGGTAAKPRFGSKGAETASRYQSSSYVKSGGFKSTQYVKSGGSYRGSRYASRSSGYSRGSRSRGGSRSFGK